MDPIDRAQLYNDTFRDRPSLAAQDLVRTNGEVISSWVTGTWLIGACYKNPNPLYGAYPHGYLERVHAMFPDARRVLHAFSGGLTHELAVAAAEKGTGKDFSGRFTDGGYVELVDLHGPEQGRFPTWQGDLLDFCEQTLDTFDLILADPPYSAADAEKYDVPMVNRAAVIRSLRRICVNGGNLVWLDQVWPMHRKDEWRTWAHIGLVRSTNHRVRLVTMFEAV